MDNRVKMLNLRNELLSVEKDRLADRNGVSLDELDAYLNRLLAEASTCGRKPQTIPDSSDDSRCMKNF